MACVRFRTSSARERTVLRRLTATCADSALIKSLICGRFALSLCSDARSTEHVTQITLLEYGSVRIGKIPLQSARDRTYSWRAARLKPIE